MRFRTRAFLFCFVPFALLLAGSFWMIQRLVQSTVRDGLRTSLLESHKAVALALAKNDLQNNHFLRVVGENAALKAGIQLLLTYPGNADARRTVEDQLRELGNQMGFALLLVSGPEGAPLAGVLEGGGQLHPIDPANTKIVQSGLTLLNGLAYQVASVPVNLADENLGMLSVGEVFDFSQFTTPTVLLHNGRVLESSVTGTGAPEIEAAMSRCAGDAECDVRLRGLNYISLPLRTHSLGEGYQLRGLQNLDSAVGPVRATLRKVFGVAAIVAVLLAFVVGAVSAGSIVRPLATVVERLQRAGRTGDLMEVRPGASPPPEIQQLIESFNRAAVTVREGRENLTRAYVEFVQSLASALDARDPYTAGHSHRVSEMSSAAAGAMGLAADAVERVRVGALLHDIGKIGVPDEVLRKPARLTEEEFALVREHPMIGRRILEGVHGFTPFLAAVELHHENWDGTGYPHGQAGEETPVDARIIHVADAYDAMTTDRPYRRGMTHSKALKTLEANAGTQFDPAVVRVFLALHVDRQRPVAEAQLC